jgi:hypothetical protein
MKQLVIVRIALAVIFIITGIARADPVVYTLYAVTAGRLGSQTFSQTEVVITFKGDTRNVAIENESGAVVYRNNQGEATVTLVQKGKKSVAHIGKGQIYVRYDITNGVVGFGSAISPTYPISLSSDIVGALSDIAAHPGDAARYSDLSGLHMNLNETTLLTGVISACAVAYTYSCPTAPTTLIHTDKGDFFVQDQGNFDEGIFTVTVGKEDQEEDAGEK